MRTNLKTSLVALLTLPLLLGCQSKQSSSDMKTYCNPVDLSYRFCLDEPSRREAADPSLVLFKGKYYLFPSKSGGFYVSDDLATWDFMPTDQIPVEDYAPTVIAIGDTLYWMASDSIKNPIFKTADPLKGKWELAVEQLEKPVWDPDLFLDDDGRLYLYWGCSNVNPTYAVEVDYKHGFAFIGEVQEIVRANPKEHGWEVSGDYNTLESKDPWLEGCWVTKVDGNYYLQYSSPGTEFKSYNDGVYVSEKPLGPFALQATNPFCLKPEGFVAGGGHGSSFADLFGNRWQIGAVSISRKHMFERRLAMFPVFCDSTGTLYADTKYGDYPMYLPTKKVKSPEELFTGWMLLSYNKPVTVSSALDTCPATNMTDESIRTYWAAKTGNAGEFASLDLGDTYDVYAVQLNFAEENAGVFGRQPNLFHRYILEYSLDGKTWKQLVDRSKNNTDNSHQYIQLDKKTNCRYLKVTNVEVPGGNFAISGFRVFGKGQGNKPGMLTKFEVSRHYKDARKVNLSWNKSEGATGYVINYGVSKDKLYQHYMVYNDTSLTINSLNAKQRYVFSIEAFNENGITKGSFELSVK